jgi:hypothetical protein
LAQKRKSRSKEPAYYTPGAIAEAMEVAKRLPIPLDQATIKKLGYTVRPGWTRALIDIPIGVAWRVEKLRRARGCSRARIYTEIITHYIVAVPEAAIDGLSAAYDQFNTAEGIAALAQAMAAAQRHNEGIITLADLQREPETVPVFEEPFKGLPPPEPITSDELDEFTMDDLKDE